MAEMTTPAFVKFEDADGLVSNVSFVDQDSKVITSSYLS